MIEALLMISVGAIIAWFVIPAPKFLIALKDTLCEKNPAIRSFLRKDV